MTAPASFPPVDPSMVTHDYVLADTRRLIEAAMGLIEIRRVVGTESAFDILVQMSVDDHSTLRAAAVRTLAHPVFP